MKRKFIKGLTMVMSVMAIASLFAGCGSSEGTNKEESNKETGESEAVENLNLEGLPIVNEQISIKAVVNVGNLSGDYEQMEMLKKLEKDTNIKVEYEEITANAWNEKKNLMLASGDVPDIFFGGGLSDTDIIKGGAQGMFIPLEDLIEKYAPNVKKLLDSNPELKKAVTSPDGHIYTLPYLDEFLPENIPDNLFINKTWLDKLGLEVPKTTEEFETVLKAFKENDPNGNGQADEIPFTYRANEIFVGDFSLSGAFGALDNKQHLMIEDGTVKFTPMMEGYKEYIKWSNKLYKDGLLDLEVFTQDGSQYTAKGKNDEMIVGAFIIYADENFVGAERAYNDYVVLEPLVGPDGDQLWNRYNNNIYLDKFAITNKNQNPEATMRWLDEFFVEDFSMEVHWGELDKNLKKEGDKYIIQAAPEGMSVDEFRFKNCPGPFAPGVMTAEMYDTLEFAIDKQRKIERYEIYDKYATTEVMPKIRFDQGELDEISIITSDVDNYVKEMKAKWITGERDVDADWASYVDQLKKMNVDRYVEIYQNGYDEYK